MLPNFINMFSLNPPFIMAKGIIKNYIPIIWTYFFKIIISIHYLFCFSFEIYNTKSIIPTRLTPTDKPNNNPELKFSNGVINSMCCYDRVTI